MSLCPDLGLFSSKSLLESNPDHRVEIRDQCHQMPYVNVDRADRQVWHCESSRSQTTIAKYAEYQVNSFKRALELAKVSIFFDVWQTMSLFVFF